MVTFREFKIGDLFDGVSGDTDIKKEHLNGEGYPVITAGVDNLGIAGYASINAKILPENSLTVDMFGNGYFRPFEYKMVTHSRVFALTLKNRPLTQEAGLFICTMLKWLQSKYNYSNMCTYNKIKNEIIQLPVKPGTNKVNYTEDDIDWAYMEAYIHELEEAYIHELDAYLKETGLNDYTLTDDEQALLEREPMFREFKVGDLFDCNTTKAFYPTKENLPEGETPYISRTTSNNGVSGFYDDIHDKFTIHHQCITVGAETGIAFWQEKPFIPGVKVYTITHKQLNSKNALFITTLLNKSANNYGFTYLRTLKKIKAEIIQLPVKPGTDEVNHTEDDIDWDYMAAYIRAMEKQVITDVVDYKDSMITTAKELIYV